MDGPLPLCDGSDGSADGSFSFERTFYACPWMPAAMSATR